MKLKNLIPTLIILSSCSGTKPANLGIDANGMLAACPDKSNCVTSFEHSDQRKEAKLDPLKAVMPKEVAKSNLKKIVSSMKGAQIITEKDDYIHAEFTSNFFKFVDDLELSFNQDGVVHFRSASRMGYSDFGVNKDRIEKIRFRFYQNDF